MVFNDKVRITYVNDANTQAHEDFQTSRSSDSNGWFHYVFHFDVDDLSSATPRLWKNGEEMTADGIFSAPGGTTPTLGRITVQVDDLMGMQDVVVWDKLLTQEDVDLIYANGQWVNPATHPSSSNIVDWYKFGYEQKWEDTGYVLGDQLDHIGGSITRTVPSSFGSGGNDLSISSVYDEDIEFIQGINPFGSVKGRATFWNELSSSLSSSFSGSHNISYSDGGSFSQWTMTSLVTGSIETRANISGTADFYNSLRTVGKYRVIIKEAGYINTTSKTTGSVQKTVISQRFSAPGSIETMTYGFLDAHNQELSAYNALPYRNLHVRGSGSGEAGTIRVNDHLGNRDGLLTHLSRHSGKFGADSLYGSIGSAGYVTKPSFHKTHRNTARKIVSGSTLANPTFNLDHDNFFVRSTIPRSDFQYSWITSSLGDNYSITSGSKECLDMLQKVEF